eukprot:TRINITY_DN4437_c0_g1_i1.p1 TRINITY_DN4437_c0_g1~~TRINITY_DN4437_c0_g1_i1.p1  ORF type:complete len:119 (-),score=39.11 TRINITY_DN4437_c0_g1_i1:45-401(-)
MDLDVNLFPAVSFNNGSVRVLVEDFIFGPPTVDDFKDLDMRTITVKLPAKPPPEEKKEQEKKEVEQSTAAPDKKAEERWRKRRRRYDRRRTRGEEEAGGGRGEKKKKSTEVDVGPTTV